MKKNSFAAVCVLFMLYFSLSCRQFDDNNTSIHVSDSEHYFKMRAYFNKHETNDIDRYMDVKIGRRSNMSFVNSRIDGKLALDDHTIFYIKKHPGYLEIKLDKDENSVESYYRIKS